MKILVMQCSSTAYRCPIKYKFFDMNNETLLSKGLVEKVESESWVLHHNPTNKPIKDISVDEPDYTCAISAILTALTDKNCGVIQSIQEIDAVGFRVVHGGEKYSKPLIITPDVENFLEECSAMAPLHNPYNIAGIKACENLLPNVPMVAMFDTAFHQTMPAKAFLYGIPYEAYEKHGVRRYGFHGMSHQYVSERTAVLMDKPLSQLKIITCHLGNGASLAAIQYGKSVDTSMGFTPLDGPIMNTRCGGIDPAIFPYLMKKEGLSMEHMDSYLNSRSGVLGLSGVSGDFRKIILSAQKGNERAEIALDVFAYTIKKFIGQYMAAMNGVDAIIFTAGIGENSPSLRAKICTGMEFIGVEIDPCRNDITGVEREISAAGSKIKLFVIPTNEELMIARETRAVCASLA